MVKDRREAHNEAQRRYRATEKGKATQRRYDESPLGRLSRALRNLRYNATQRKSAT